VDGDAGALPLSELTPMTPNSTASPSTSAMGNGGGAQAAAKTGVRLNGVFGDDVDELDEFAYMKNARKKLKPFEITIEVSSLLLFTFPTHFCCKHTCASSAIRYLTYSVAQKNGSPKVRLSTARPVVH
jgi:hypothetical protein